MSGTWPGDDESRGDVVRRVRKEKLEKVVIASGNVWREQEWREQEWERTNVDPGASLPCWKWRFYRTSEAGKLVLRAALAPRHPAAFWECSKG